jgi:hypothetical protein
VTVFGVRGESAKRPGPDTVAAGALACRLSGADRVSAIFLQPGMVKALASERSTFARMFDALPAPGGIRAKATGGTTAMFAIVDGDVLLRADGVIIKSSDAIISEILGRVERGNSVVVEGERNGSPRRWVYAPSSCAVQGAEPRSSSKASG